MAGQPLYASKALLAAVAASGLSGATLATKLDVSPTYIYQIRRGRSLPHNNGINTVAAALAALVGAPVEEALSPDPPLVRRTSRRQAPTSRPLAPARAAQPAAKPAADDLSEAEIERRFQAAAARIRADRNRSTV